MIVVSTIVVGVARFVFLVVVVVVAAAAVVVVVVVVVVATPLMRQIQNKTRQDRIVVAVSHDRAFLHGSARSPAKQQQ